MREFMLSPESMESILAAPENISPLSARKLCALYKKASRDDKIRISNILGAYVSYDDTKPASDDK